MTLSVSAHQLSRLPPFGALRAFEAAARLGSFRRASDELHVTPSAVSQQVKLLEGYLGVPLFLRLPRALELTREGESMLPAVREGFATFTTAMKSVMRNASSGPVMVDAPPTFARRWLVPRLPRFAQAYPQVELHLTSSLAMVDGRGEAAAAETAIAIRYGAGVYPGLRVDRIFRASYVPVCSPSLLKGPHALRSPADLRHHTLIHDETVPDERARPSWAQWLKLEGVTGIDAARGPHFSDGSLAIEAAADGQGVTLALRPLVEADVKAGRLAIPFDAPVPSGYAYYLVTPAIGELAPGASAFRHWLLLEAAAVN